MNRTPATLRARNPFPCHTSEKSPHNSNHCHTSKTAVFKPCVCHTSETPRGSALPTWELATRLPHLKFFLFIPLRTLLHLQKSQLLYFQAIPHSLPKTTRGGGTPAQARFGENALKVPTVALASLQRFGLLYHPSARTLRKSRL